VSGIGKANVGGVNRSTAYWGFVFMGVVLSVELLANVSEHTNKATRAILSSVKVLEQAKCR
jgi:hypothetical protein